MQHLVQLTVMERCANQWHLNLGCTAAFDTLFSSNLSEACTAGITNALLHMILKVVLLWQGCFCTAAFQHQPLVSMLGCVHTDCAQISLFVTARNSRSGQPFDGCSNDMGNASSCNSTAELKVSCKLSLLCIHRAVNRNV